MLAQQLNAQSKQVDSLKQVLKTSKEDTNKINVLNILGKQLYLINVYDTAELYAKQALELAGKIHFISRFSDTATPAIRCKKT